MPESQEERDSAVVSSAGEPGPLSRLLQELADASGDDALDAWKKELQPGDRVDRFEIRREVGRGGFGAVYEAFDMTCPLETWPVRMQPQRCVSDETRAAMGERPHRQERLILEEWTKAHPAKK